MTRSFMWVYKRPHTRSLLPNITFNNSFNKLISRNMTQQTQDKKLCMIPGTLTKHAVHFLYTNFLYRTY
jgi:hypothetical protein